LSINGKLDKREFFFMECNGFYAAAAMRRCRGM
jgi:hypothetical protein